MTLMKYCKLKDKALNRTMWRSEKGEVTGRRTRRRKQLLDDFNERRGYCKLVEEALDRRELVLEEAVGRS